MTTEGTWHVEWYWPDDAILVRYTGYLSAKMAVDSLDRMHEMQENTNTDLKIYIITEQSQVTDFDESVPIQITLHPAAFHPRSGKIYFVGCSRELRLAYEGLNFRRPDTARFADTIEEAAQAIQQSRAAYRARQQAAKEHPNEH
jgi:hypothetical protein